MESIFEKMGGTYRWEGDYLIPDLMMSDTTDYQIGRYGRLRQRYLKEHRGGIYVSLELSGKLLAHLAEIDKSCNERMDLLVSQIAQREGVA